MGNPLRYLKRKYYRWYYHGKYKNPLYKEWRHLADMISNWHKARELNKAKRLANARYRATGKTHYVLPDGNGRPMAFSNTEIMKLKRLKLMNKRVTCLDLYKEAMYVANGQTCRKA